MILRVSAPWRWTRPQPQSAPLSGNARVPPTGVPNAHGCGIVMNACFGVGGEMVPLLISPACIAAGTSAKIMLILTHFGVSGDDPARLLLLLLLVLVLL